MKIIKRLTDYASSHGFLYTAQRLFQKAGENLWGTYDRKWQREKPTMAELENQRNHQPECGLISVIIPVYNTDPKMLWSLLFSLEAQTLENWEAILYDGCSTRKDTQALLQEFGEKDSRLKIIFGEINKGISGNTNLAAAQAKGEYLALCDHDDLLSPDALWRVAEAISQEAPDMLYSDEDMITENGVTHISPHYKPDFCPENLNSGNYICHLLVVRKSLFDLVGGLRSGFDGSQDHDLALRLTEETDRIVHLPYTLYTWRKVNSSMSHRHLDACLDAGCRAVAEHMVKKGYRLHAEPVNSEIRLWYEIIGDPSVETIPLTSYSAANAAAAESEADYLFFADPGLKIKHPECFMTELLMYAQQEGIGAVTPVLTDRHRHITHGGYALGFPGIACCVNEKMHAGAGGWHDMMNTVHNVSAVSPCAMLIRRDRFLPFNERYHTGLGAVDLCLRLKENGLRHVYVPHAEAVCTRQDMLLSGNRRDPEDTALFTECYGSGITDPCYGSRFSKKKANFSLK